MASFTELLDILRKDDAARLARWTYHISQRDVDLCIFHGSYRCLSLMFNWGVPMPPNPIRENIVNPYRKTSDRFVRTIDVLIQHGLNINEEQRALDRISHCLYHYPDSDFFRPLIRALISRGEECLLYYHQIILQEQDAWRQGNQLLLATRVALVWSLRKHCACPKEIARFIAQQHALIHCDAWVAYIT